MSIHVDVDRIIEEYDKENANLQLTPETIHKKIADIVMKEYTLSKFPHDIAKAHKEGVIHLHDLEYQYIRPVCMQHDLRPFFKYGLRVDGTGLHTSISGPAKHPEVAILHTAKVLAAAQTNMSGGQSIDLFNIWLAPYMEGLEYDEIKQYLQMFIYELNQMYVARGGQTVFASVNLELSIPDFIKDVEAIRGGEEVGTYGDYKDEAIMIAKALLEVMFEGDYVGKPHLFPNTILKIRSKKDMRSELFDLAHDLVIKFGTPYFLNLTKDWQGDNVNSMGCRTRLSNTWTGDPLIDTLRTGCMQWNSLNLPRLSYMSGGNYEHFLRLIEDYVKLIVDALIIKTRWTLNKLHVLPFISQKFDGETYYRFEHTTKTVGFVGLNEALKFLFDIELHEDPTAGLEIISYIRELIDGFEEELSMRMSLTQTPAESTAGRFAQLDLHHYPTEAKQVLGDRVYYTNSSHVRVDAPIPIIQKAEIEGEFHPLCNGGHITHIWLYDAIPDKETLMSLTKKIIVDTNVGYFAYSRLVNFCEHCYTISYGANPKCPKCGKPMETYTRITGYLQKLSNFNKAKVQETQDRITNIW